MVFKTGGGEAMKILHNGRVGIGTSSPAYHFHLKDTGNGTIYQMEATGGNNIYKAFTNTGGTSYIGTENQDWKLYVGGSVKFEVTSSGGQSVSDQKFKKDIEDISYGLDTVKALQPRKFTWKDSEEDSIGFIAQEVQPIISEVINVPTVTPPEGMETGMSMNYSALTAVLTKAIQELSTKLEAAEARITTLEDNMTTKVQAEFLAPGIISDQTQVSAASGDHVLIFDASDNSLKKCLISTIAGGLALDDIGSGDAAATLATSSGNIILDTPGDIVLDAGGENVIYKVNGTEIGQIDLGSANFNLRSSVSDKDVVFLVNDGGTEIEAMRIDASEGGRVGIGESSPLGKLHVKSGESSGSADANADELVIEGAGNHGIQFLGPNDSYMQMLFGDSDDSDVGYLSYNHSTNALGFGVNAAERLQLTSAGFLKFPSKFAFTGQGDAGIGHHTNNYMYVYGGSAGLVLQDNSGGSNRILLRDSNSIEFEVAGNQKQYFIHREICLLVVLQHQVDYTYKKMVQKLI